MLQLYWSLIVPRVYYIYKMFVSDTFFVCGIPRNYSNLTSLEMNPSSSFNTSLNVIIFDNLYTYSITAYTITFYYLYMT